MSGHDFIDWPHKTTHEIVCDQVAVTPHDWMPSATRGSGVGQTCDGALTSGLWNACANAEGSPESPPLGRIAAQWTRWPNVKPREAAERRSGPRNNWSTTR